MPTGVSLSKRGSPTPWLVAGTLMVLIIAALALYMPGSLTAQSGPRGYFNAPSMDLHAYEVVELAPGYMLCRPVGDGSIGCSPPLPAGSMLLIPKHPVLARPDST